MRKLLLSCLAVIGLGLGGTVIAQTIGSVSNGYIEEGNLVRAGNILRTIAMTNANHARNARTCKQACDADGNCYAYTYRQVRAQFKPECQLRMIANPTNSRRDHGFDLAVSATKSSFVADVLKMQMTSGQAIMGGTISRKFDVANADPIACLDACWRDNNCQGATYFPKGFFKGRGPSCTMYSQTAKLTSATPIAGVVTAIKSTGARPATLGNTPRPRITPRPKTPVIEQPSGQTIIIPDTTPEENPSPSDDDDAQFPGEMLEPERQ